MHGQPYRMQSTTTPGRFASPLFWVTVWKLARELANQLQPSQTPETSILWLEADELAGGMIAELEKLGLVWRLPGRGVRVLCRSDVVAGATLSRRATTSAAPGPGTEGNPLRKRGG